MCVFVRCDPVASQPSAPGNSLLVECDLKDGGAGGPICGGTSLIPHNPLVYTCIGCSPNTTIPHGVPGVEIRATVVTINLDN